MPFKNYLSKRNLTIVLPALICVLLFAAAAFGVVLPRMQEAIMARQRESVRELVHVVISVLEAHQQQVAEGRLTPEQARRRALKLVGGLRFGPENKDYFWINDLDCRLIAHPYRADLMERDLSDFRDPEGKRILAGIVALARQRGSGWLDYHWQWQDDPGRVEAKLSYIKLFAPWDWVVGAGIYLNQARAESSRLTRDLILVVAGILGLVLLMSAYIVYRGVRTEMERSAATEQLRASEERLRTIHDSTPLPITTWQRQNGDFVLIDVNQAGQAFTEGKLRHFVGTKASQFFAGRLDIYGDLERSYLTKGPVLRETPYTLISSGSSRHIIMSTVFAPPDLVLQHVLDLTQRKEAEKALAESEERHRRLLEAAPVAVFILREGCFSYLNPEALRLFGAGSARELEGKPYLDMVHPQDREESARRLEKMRDQGGTVSPRRHRYVNLRGEVLYVESVGAGLELRGAKVLQIMAVDLTERQRTEQAMARLEEQLRQSQKMEAVGTLAGGIAHDFNNILGAVLGYAELARDLGQEGKENLAELDEIIAAALRARDLVRQILTFSRKVDTLLKPLDLNQEVKRAAAILERTLPKMISPRLALDPELRRINGDANQIEQVLINLASNARDAMPQGGELILETRNVVLEDWQRARGLMGVEPGPYVLLRVSDTGTGMDQSTQSQIFDPFFTTKEVGQGTGLGLSTVYGIVRGHGGYIQCTSLPGQGTTFHIYLPALQQVEDPWEEAPEESEEIQGGNETVLVVDDEESLRGLARQIMGRAGYDLRWAASGEQALELYQEQGDRVDLVILDLGMPGMGGLKCLERLRRLDPQVKVLVASGYSHQGMVNQVLAAGAAAFVAKPFRKKDLLGMVRQVLDEPPAP